MLVPAVHVWLARSRDVDAWLISRQTALRAFCPDMTKVSFSCPSTSCYPPARHPAASMEATMRKHHDDSPAFDITSKRRKSFPSETRVKRGRRIVRGDVELSEKLGRNDLCPCGSGRRFKACCMASGGHDGSNRHGYFQGLGGWPDCSGHPRLLQGWKASCRSPAFAQRKPGLSAGQTGPAFSLRSNAGYVSGRAAGRGRAGDSSYEGGGDGDRDGQESKSEMVEEKCPSAGAPAPIRTCGRCASAIRRNPWRRRARSAAASAGSRRAAPSRLARFCPFRDTMTDNSVARSNRSSPRPDQ